MATDISNSIANIVSTTGTTSTQATQTKTMGKDDFMKLLLAQLKNQDPLNPMSNTDFAAQLAQFSSLEQLTNLNTEIQTQGVNQMTLGYAQSANMVGKEVITNSGNAITANGSTVDLNYSLDKDAQSVTISILDQSGNVVKTWNEASQKAGTNTVTWDSSNVTKGDYTFQVAAKDSQGQAVSTSTMTTGLVTAVNFKNNQISAIVNGQEIPLSNIVEIKQP